MAIGDILGPFMWGEGGQKLSPDEVARQRALASRLASQVGDTSPVGHWTQGLTRVTEALRGNLTDWRANQAEQAGLAEAQSAISPILAALGGGSSPSAYGQSQTVNNSSSGASPIRTGSAPSAPFQGNQQEFIEMLMPYALEASKQTGVDPRIIIAQSAQETGWGRSAPNNNYFGIKSHGQSGGGTFATTEFVNGKPVTIQDSFRGYASPGESVMGYADFINTNPRYGNFKGAGDLDSQLAELQRSGYATDPNYSNSVGSIAKGITLPSDFMVEQQSVDTPFGDTVETAMAYADPMQSQTAQPQLGSAALAAIEQVSPQAAQAVQSMPPQAQQQAFQAMQQNPAQAGDLLASIMQAQANPWVQKQYGGMLNSLMTNEINQRNQANDPLRQLQIQQAQLQLQQAQNPYQATPASPEQLAQWGIDPNAQGWTIGPDGTPQQVYAPQQPKPVFEGGQWWDTSTGMPAALTEPVQSNPANVMEYKFYADQAQELGQQPLPYGEWDLARRQSGATQVNVGGEGQRMGTIPAGMAAVPDPTNPSGFRMEAIPGGPAAQQAEAEAAQAIKASEQASRYGNVVLEDIDRAVSAIETDPLLTTGVVGQWMSGVGGTPANRVGNLLSTIKANAGFDRLQAMRDASPTGGALGSVSEMELALLNSAIGSLEQSNNPDDLVYNLKRVQGIYDEIVNGSQPKTDPMFDGAFSSIQQANPNQPMNGNALDESTMLETLIGNESTYNPIPIGTIEDGWVYIGGNPAQQQSWQRAR